MALAMLPSDETPLLECNMEWNGWKSEKDSRAMIGIRRGIGRRRSIGGKSNTITLETDETAANVHVHRKKHVGIMQHGRRSGARKQVEGLSQHRSSRDSHVSGKCVPTTSRGFDSRVRFAARDKFLPTF